MAIYNQHPKERIYSIPSKNGIEQIFKMQLKKKKTPKVMENYSIYILKGNTVCQGKLTPSSEHKHIF